MLPNVLWPIFAILAIGYALGKWGLPPQPVARLSFWALMPAMIFVSLYESTISPGVFGLIFLFVLLFSLAMWGAGDLAGRLLGLEAHSRAGLALTLILTNCGNYGLPFLLFSLGQEAFDLGVVYLIGQTILLSTLGVLIALRGERFSPRAFAQVLKTPLLYAVAAGMALRQSGLWLPEYLVRPLSMLSQAAIPVLMILLGLQLSQVRLGRQLKLRGVGWATALRLLGAPLLSWPLLALLRIDGLLGRVLLIEASTPAAVNSLLLAIEYGRDPELVSSIVLLTTVLSSATLPVILMLSGR
ncbi:MAG: AEC family transporter [Candidatus Acetothermia bacterium]|jgi:predicted permease|nr:AEC family transporter [Candidatus Acetothermia bacterium]MDH7504529.1 AEC family transporter [Candidatus Acetothermia bacterium]